MPGQRNASRRAARCVDVVVGGLLLLLSAPLLAVLALLVRWESSGPALFRQVRVGHRQQPFVMLKFRTMRVDCDEAAHREFVTAMLRGEDPRGAAGATALFKLTDDPRVTRVGAVLRRTSLDELPQLLHVVRGQMALVGPRPALPWEVALYRPDHLARFQVRPGMTGLWQVSGRGALSMSEALDLDVEYAGRADLLLDLRILVRTLPALLARRTA